MVCCLCHRSNQGSFLPPSVGHEPAGPRGGEQTVRRTTCCHPTFLTGLFPRPQRVRGTYVSIVDPFPMITRKATVVFGIVHLNLGSHLPLCRAPISTLHRSRPVTKRTGQSCGLDLFKDVLHAMMDNPLKLPAMEKCCGRIPRLRLKRQDMSQAPPMAIYKTVGVDSLVSSAAVQLVPVLLSYLPNLRPSAALICSSSRYSTSCSPK